MKGLADDISVSSAQPERLEMLAFVSALRSERLSSAYYVAKELVVSSGYDHELQWQSGLTPQAATESDFLREYAWVTLCCGMKEKVVRTKFPFISHAFYYWRSAGRILGNQERCRRLALAHFRHPGKIGGIIHAADVVCSVGFTQFKRDLVAEPLKTLQGLPYMGPATSRHLAKNLGLPFAKPDRHLRRIAEACGHTDVQRLCDEISSLTGDQPQLVDLVLWRFATICGTTSSVFRAQGSEV